MNCMFDMNPSKPAVPETTIVLFLKPKVEFSQKSLNVGLTPNIFIFALYLRKETTKANTNSKHAEKNNI